MIVGKQDTYFTIDELAEMARVSPKTVRNWLAEGTIKGVLLGRHRFVPSTAIEEALLNRTLRSHPMPREMEKQVLLVRRDVRAKEPGQILRNDGSQVSQGCIS